jgi:dynein heavy chain
VQAYQKIALEVVKKNIKHGGIIQYFNEKDPKLLAFAPFFNDDLAHDDVSDIGKLRKRLEESLEEYNESNPNMDLVLFDDACKHVCRIARVVISESGHALLVGVGGSGKQSLTRLSGFMNRYSTTGIVVTSD